MVVVGVDVHKRSHTFVAVDEVGKRLGQIIVMADGEGHDKAIIWAQREFGTDLRWGSRTVGTSRRGWRSICSTPTRRWCGAGRTDG